MLYDSLVLTGDMKPRYNFPRRGYLFVFVTTFVSARISPSGTVCLICVVGYLRLTLKYGATARDVWNLCLGASRDPSGELQ